MSDRFDDGVGVLPCEVLSSGSVEILLRCFAASRESGMVL